MGAVAASDCCQSVRLRARRILPLTMQAGISLATFWARWLISRVFMPQFAYKARRRTGEVVQGVLEVPDRAAALAQIERQGLFPVMVDASRAGLTAAEKAEKSKDGPPKSRGMAVPEVFRRRRHRKPKLQELATFTTQLSNLLKCGMPLTVALQSMTHLETKGIPSDVSKNLKQEVMEGSSLSDAMTKQPHVFSDLYRNMVQAGEQSGALVEVLKRLS